MLVLVQSWCNGREKAKTATVEPVYDGSVLSGHPLLGGQFSKSRFFAHTNAMHPLVEFVIMEAVRLSKEY